MSAIFKSRKIPRHLVIEPETVPIRRKRRILPAALICCLVLLVFAMVLQRL